jgi:hypothetical protein
MNIDDHMNFKVTTWVLTPQQLTLGLWDQRRSVGDADSSSDTSSDDGRVHGEPINVLSIDYADIVRCVEVTSGQDSTDFKATSSKVGLESGDLVIFYIERTTTRSRNQHVVAAVVLCGFCRNEDGHLTEPYHALLRILEQLVKRKQAYHEDAGFLRYGWNAEGILNRFYISQ